MYHALLLAGLFTASSYAAAPSNIFAKNFPSLGVTVGDGTLLHLMLDTGSPELWVNGANTHSTTSINVDDSLNLNYITYKATGHIARDTIHIGDENSITLPDASVYGLADGSVTPAGYDGIIGMGIGMNSDVQAPYSMVWDQVKKQLDPPIMGVRMQMPIDGDPADDDVVGQVDWGKTDAQYDLTWTKVATGFEHVSWTINVDALHVNGNANGGTGKMQPLLDSGRAGIVLSVADAKKINEALGGSEVADASPTDTYWKLPCDLGDKKLEVVIEGKTFAIPNYLIPSRTPLAGDTKNCQSLIAGRDGQPVLGTGFMQAVYSGYDYEKLQVGFASLPPPKGARK